LWCWKAFTPPNFTLPTAQSILPSSMKVMASFGLYYKTHVQIKHNWH
jgi:hypothetical protein